MLVAAGAGRFFDRRGRARRPIAQQLADQVLQPRPIQLAGHAEDRPVGTIIASELRADVVDGGGFQGLLFALGRPAPRLGIVLPPQLDHHLLRRLVLDGPKLLQHRQPAGLQLVLGQMRIWPPNAWCAKPETLPST